MTANLRLPGHRDVNRHVMFLMFYL